MSIAPQFSQWFLFSLPDSLWVFSYVCLMFGIWKGVISPQNLLWIGTVPLIAIASEFGQLLGFVRGTFDIMDVLCYLLGSILPFLIFNQFIKYNNLKFLQHEKKF